MKVAARIVARFTTHFACVLTLARLCSGCASERLPVVEEGGKSVWQRVETEHFVVESNVEDGWKLRRTASDFETLWHAFASVPLLGLNPPGEKPIVVLFDSTSEYRYFAGAQTSGLFHADTVVGPVILLPPNSGLFQEVVVKHELSHFVASDFLRDAPTWLTEGLAQVMETARYDTEKGEVVFGDFLRGRVDTAARSLPSRLFMGEWPQELTTRELQRYYARSWLLVHYLIDYHLKEFLKFLVSVSAGKNWRDAWSDEISLRLDGIDDALDRYHLRAKYGLWSVVATLPDMDAFTESVAPRADVYALRAVLQACASNPARETSQKRAAAQLDFEQALNLDPASARVQRLRAPVPAVEP